MPQMVATSEIEYPPGKFWKPGDRFEVEEAHTKLLETLGRAKLPDAEVAAPEIAPPRRGPGRPPKAR